MPSFLGQETQTAVAFCPDSPTPPPPPRQGAGPWNSGISGGWTAYRFFIPEDRPVSGQATLAGSQGVQGWQARLASARPPNPRTAGAGRRDPPPPGSGGPSARSPRPQVSKPSAAEALGLWFPKCQPRSGAWPVWGPGGMLGEHPCPHGGYMGPGLRAVGSETQGCSPFAFLGEERGKGGKGLEGGATRVRGGRSGGRSVPRAQGPEDKPPPPAVS